MAIPFILALLFATSSAHAATSCVQNKESGAYEASHNGDACPVELALFSGEQATKGEHKVEAEKVEVGSQYEVATTHTANAPTESTWHLKAEDGSVYAALKRWAKTSGWQLSWEIPVDFPIEILDSSTGTFEDAVRRVLTAFRVADYPPYPCFHENKVVRVIRRIQGNDDECKQ